MALIGRTCGELLYIGTLWHGGIAIVSDTITEGKRNNEERAPLRGLPMGSNQAARLFRPAAADR